MKIKPEVFSTTIILVITIAVSLFALPATSAHTPAWNIPTWAFISVQPNPIGIGQQAFVNFWIDKVPPTATGPYGDRWENFKVTVTKPDGTTETLGPFKSDAVGGSYATYTPTVLGTYSFEFNFPGQTITGANPHPVSGVFNPSFVGDKFGPSTSQKVTLTVQQDSIQPYPTTPLPTGFWARPIFAQNAAWYTLGGNWLGLNPVSFGTAGQYNASGNFNPYTKAPNTAHIVWTKPYSFGGLMGGEFGDSQFGSNFMSTSQYEPKFQPIIIHGVLYYTLFPGSATNPAGWVALDLRTGQTIWTKQTTALLRAGQVYNFISPNQYGGIPYLWSIEPTIAPNTGTTYGMYDAMTGNWILNVVNGTGYIPGTAGNAVTSGTPAVTVNFVEADDGSLLGYYVNPVDSTLNMWNSSRAILKVTALSPTGAWMWRPPQGASIAWSNGIQWSVPVTKVPTTTTTSNTTVLSPLNIRKIGSDVVLMGSFGETGEVTTFSWQAGYQIEAGYNAKTGQLLWGPINRTLTPWTRINMGRSLVAMNGVYNEYEMETFSMTGYSLATGQKVWGPTEPFNTTAWAYYEVQAIAGYGNIYINDLGGAVHAYNLATGEHLWDWYSGTSGYETPYGIWPILKVEAVADGKVYVSGGHMYSPPLFRGSRLYALNAYTGKEVWSILDFPITNSATAAIADGYMVEANAYDNQVYCFGMGPTATTVEAPLSAIAKGSSLVLQGTVIDMSAGTKQTALAANFPFGVPAVSDASMSPWMEYLYEQQPKPTDTKGVPVLLTAIDPSGNNQEIGTVVSNSDGSYAFAWTPPAQGLYKITATFAGSNSYYSSSGTTHVLVGTVPSGVVTPTPTTPQGPGGVPASTLYAIAAAIVIILAVVVAAIALRRRK